MVDAVCGFCGARFSWRYRPWYLDRGIVNSTDRLSVDPDLADMDYFSEKTGNDKGRQKVYR